MCRLLNYPLRWTFPLWHKIGIALISHVVSVPFPSALLMMKSEGVHLLVLHGAVAADTAAARLVVDGLLAPNATNV